MNDSTYLALMLRHRNEGIRFTQFFRPIWFVGMLVLSAGAVFFLREQDAPSNDFGWLIVGFLLARVFISFRLYRRAIASWPVYEKYLNWDLIEAQLDKTAE